jgi:hypothetical protein
MTGVFGILNEIRSSWMFERLCYGLVICKRAKDTRGIAIAIAV